MFWNLGEMDRILVYLTSRMRIMRNYLVLIKDVGKQKVISFRYNLLYKQAYLLNLFTTA